MPENRESRAPEAVETPWTDYVETLLRWRRFVVGGTLIAWAAIALLVLLIPPQYTCTAAVALPGTTVPVPLFGGRLFPPPAGHESNPQAAASPKPVTEACEGARGSGIAPPLYKRLERALADEAVLGQGLGGRLDASRVRTILDRSHFTPISTGPVSTLNSGAPTGAIEAVQISYVDASPQRARDVVTALGSLVREALITVTVLDQIETETLQASSFAVQAARERMHLEAENESLPSEENDLARLVRETPGAGTNSPQAQLIAIKVTMADNARRARELARASEIAALHVAFLSRLDQAFREEFQRRGCQLSADPARTIRATLDVFLESEKDPASAATYLRADVNGRAAMLAAVRAGTRFIQFPTLKPRPRGLLIGAVLFAALALFVGAALAGESWSRHRRSC